MKHRALHEIINIEQILYMYPEFKDTANKTTKTASTNTDRQKHQ